MTQRKKILFLVRLYHPHIGGVEKHVKEISNILSKKGHQITILTERFDSRLPSRATVKGIDVLRIPVPKNERFKKFYIWFWVLKNLFRFYGSDIIHVHDVFYWVLPFRPFLFYKKIYITFHGYEGYPVKIRWVILRRISQMLSNGSICVGEFMKKWYKAKPDFVIYGGVRQKKIKKGLVDKKSAVFFGRLDSQTGLEQYIKAYKIIKNKFPDFKLTVVGEGELADKIPKGIKIVPFVEDTSEFIAKNRFIFVSRYLSMLEALSFGREVIASYDNPIKKDYLLMSPFKNYIYIAKNNQDIANIVTGRMIAGGENKQLTQGKKWAEKQNWNKIVTAYSKLWKK